MLSTLTLSHAFCPQRIPQVCGNLLFVRKLFTIDEIDERENSERLPCVLKIK